MRRRLVDREDTTYGIGTSPLATLRAGVSLWARNLLPLTGFALVPAAAAFCFEWIAGGTLADGGASPADARQAAAALAGLMTFPLAYGAAAATYLLLDARCRGHDRQTGPVSFYGRGLKLFGRLFGVFFMLGLALLAPGIPALVLWRLDLLVAAIPLAVLAVCFDVWLLVRWSLAAPIAVLEGATFSVAFARSVELVRGAWWRTFATLVPAGLAVALLTAGIWQAGAALGELAEAGETTSQAIANLVIGTVTSPPLDCVLFALYAASRDRETSARRTQSE